MPIYRLGNGSLEEIQGTTFENEMILERQHLQAAIRSKVGAVLPDCMIIGEEFSSWTESRRRPDLIGLDRNANIVVFELKRTETGAEMELQAIRYAAMLSTITFRQTIEMYQSFRHDDGNESIAENEILDFLGWEEPQEEDFAQDVRIVLIAADFSKEITSTVMWLNDRNIDIRCIRVSPYRYGEDVLLDIQQILPLPEAEDYQIRIRRKLEERREAIRGDRDLTKYRYAGKVYNKRQLVKAVILDWVRENHPRSFMELQAAFPEDLRRRPVYGRYEDAIEIYNRTNIARHFIADDEVLDFPDGEKHVISNQWGVDIQDFVKHATSIGVEIVSA